MGRRAVWLVAGCTSKIQPAKNISEKMERFSIRLVLSGYQSAPQMGVTPEICAVRRFFAASRSSRSVLTCGEAD